MLIVEEYVKQFYFFISMIINTKIPMKDYSLNIFEYHEYQISQF